MFKKSVTTFAVLAAMLLVAPPVYADINDLTSGLTLTQALQIAKESNWEFKADEILELELYDDEFTGGLTGYHPAITLGNGNLDTMSEEEQAAEGILYTKILVLKKVGSDYMVIHVMDNPPGVYANPFYEFGNAKQEQAYIAESATFLGAGLDRNEKNFYLESKVVNEETYEERFTLSYKKKRYPLLTGDVTIRHGGLIAVSADGERLTYIHRDGTARVPYLWKFIKIQTADGEAFKLIGR